MTKDIVLFAKNLTKLYSQGQEVVHLLQDASLTLKAGEIVGLVGESGCGKTTLLQILGLLDEEYRGEVLINDRLYHNASDYERSLCRRSRLGFVYQSHNLLSDFSAKENVMLPLLLNNVAIKEAEKKTEIILRELELLAHADQLPHELSGGQQQRVAIARSLVHKPKIVFADEPTGNLDPHNADLIFKIFIDFVRKHNASALIVTHNLQLAKKLDRVLTIKNGQIIEL